jgi:dihydrofolate reductase
MRNIVARLCISEDGIVERPEYWLPGSGLAGVFDRLATGAETVLLGRSTFEQYAASVARHHVLRALKHVPGADIHVVGSVKLVRSLLRWRLIDEVSLLIHPVQAGFGSPLFEDRRGLRLISMCAGDSGVLEASYRVDYAATATSSTAASAGRWGGTWSTDSVATTARTAISTHA